MAINKTILDLTTSTIEIRMVDTIADDKYIFKIVDVDTSGVLYENTGYAASSFSSPDGTATGVTLNVDIDLVALPTLEGDIQISYKRLRSGTTTTVVNPNQKTGRGTLDAAFTITFSCVTGAMTVRDDNTYPSPISSLNASFNVTFPQSVISNQVIAVTTANLTYNVSALYTGTYSILFSGYYTQTLATSPYTVEQIIYFSLTKTQLVECNKDICEARCMVNNAYTQWVSGEDKGSQATWNNFVIGASILSLAIASYYYCGKDITPYITQLHTIYGDCSCGCTDEEGVPVLIRPCLCN